MILGERLMGVNEEYMDVTPRAVFVYTSRFEYEQAKKLADQIVRQRKQWPFMTWRTNIPQQPGFEDFIDALDSGYFPPPDRCEVIDPDQPMNTQIRAMIMMAGGGGSIR